jgi:hypothetical protein
MQVALVANNIFAENGGFCLTTERGAFCWLSAMFITRKDKPKVWATGWFYGLWLPDIGKIVHNLRSSTVVVRLVLIVGPYGGA